MDKSGYEGIGMSRAQSLGGCQRVRRPWKSYLVR